MRSVNDRIKWFRAHRPKDETGVIRAGLCLRHTWMATDIPWVGLADANAALEYVRRHGHLRTNRNPPRGAWVFWWSSTHGHVAISVGDQRIVSTDVNGPGSTGEVGLGYPEIHWGHIYEGWTDWYGVPFTVTTPRTKRLRRRRGVLREKLRHVIRKLRGKDK